MQLKTLAATAALVLTISSIAAQAPVYAATAGAPSSLKANASGTATVLMWSPGKSAGGYEVELSKSSNFASVFHSARTDNLAYAPAIVMPSGKIYWRVRSDGMSFSDEPSAWVVGSFTKKLPSAPVVAGPQDDAVITLPNSNPVLRWKPVPGADSYQVSVATVDDFSDSIVYESEGTSVLADEHTTPGEHFWRVRATFSAATGEEVGSWSTPRTYTLQGLAEAQVDTTPQTMEDIALSWEKVPGAAYYEIRVSSDKNFNNIVAQTETAGTGWSPSKTLNNASYWWQVRAYDTLGNTTSWPTYPENTGEVRRNWLQKTELQAPADKAAVDQNQLVFSWKGIDKASDYLLDIGSDPNFSSTDFFKTCTTQNTTYAVNIDNTQPSLSSARCAPKGGGTFYWRVRAVDEPTGVNSLISEVREFTYTPTAVTPATLNEVTGHTVKLSTTGGCEKSLDAGVCQNIPATPLLSWDPVPGAVKYYVYLSYDENLTNLVPGYGDPGAPDKLPTAFGTSWAPALALPDNQAGEAYYWYIRPCGADKLCGPTPSQAAAAFTKTSPQVETLTPATDTEVTEAPTFTWEKYLTTNQGSPDSTTGGVSQQAAASYRIQVAKNASFSKESLVDDQVIDQTTYTPFEDAYPTGSLHWRVQAIDADDNGLPWSQVQTFTHTIPVPVLAAPANDAKVADVPPLSWKASLGAKGYDVEVYSSADKSGSSENKELSLSGWEWTSTGITDRLPVSAKSYVWRVRAVNYSGNKSAWSSWRTFKVTPAAPKLKSPGSGKTVTGSRAVFTWSAVPVAQTYQLQVERNGEAISTGFSRGSNTAGTVTQKLNPGKYRWRASAYDAGGKLVGTSSWRYVIVR